MTEELWLFELAPRLTRLENVALKDIGPGLTFRQYRIMRRVSEGSRTVSSIGRLATISLPAISESVDGLVRKGLLERHVDLQDRRSAPLELTNDGELVLQQAENALDGLAERILVGLTMRQREDLRRSVLVVADNVTELLRETP